MPPSLVTCPRCRVPTRALVTVQLLGGETIKVCERCAVDLRRSMLVVGWPGTPNERAP